jgi:hypothetical protein
MTATISIPFAIGQRLWVSSSGHGEEWITCPECDGAKILTLVKGNGEVIELSCNYCAPGCESPSGVVRRIVYDCQPVPFVPKRVEMYGQEFRYSESEPDATAYQTFAAGDIFEDREACSAACVTKNAEYRANAERQEIANLASKRKNLEHSSHYWTTRLRSLERDAEIVRRRLAVIKEAKATKS